MKTTILALLGFLILAVPESVKAQFEYTTNADETLTITGYSGPDGTVTIPTNIDGLTVTSIGIGAFWRNAILTNVTIPDGVIAIGGDAFADCDNLTNVAIQDSVTNIGDGAFQGCVSLASVAIPNGLIEIGMSEFNGCVNLNSIVIPDSVTVINFEAFGNCSNLGTVTVPGSVAAIGSAAFDSCVNLTNLYFEGNAPHIDSTLLNSDTNAIVYFPPCATGWSNTFAGRPALAATPPSQFIYATNDGTITIDGYSGSCGEVVIPASIYGQPVASIGDSAFVSQTSLTSIVTSILIPASVTNIGQEAFNYCTGLGNVTIPGSVVSIGGFAFSYCGGLTNVTIKDGVRSIGDFAFNWCSGLIAVAIPGSVTNVGDGIFASCGSLANVLMVNAVTSIGQSEFAYCEGLTNVTIPAGLTSIGSFAFYECLSLGSVTIPSSVISIGDSAFAYSGLNSVAISGGLTSIGDDAFSSCYNLVSLKIPYSVTNIEPYAFQGCYALTDVFFSGDTPNSDEPASLFFGDHVTVYYLPGSVGWSNTFGSQPAILWNPTIQVADRNFGIKNNRFGFNVSGTADIPFVVEACTNLANPMWQPLQTNTLAGGVFYFDDSQWTNYPGRFYRIQWP